MKIEKISCGMANAYLLHGDNSGILIDTGAKYYKDKVLKQCQNANVRLIVLTHGHFDHCQNAAYLAGKLNCKVGIAQEDVPLIENNQKRKVFGRGIWGKFYANASNHNIRSNEIERVTPDVILEKGMSLSEYGINGGIIKLPGHTAGSVGVLLSSGELFVGDAMQNIILPAKAWCFEDYGRVQESVKLIQTIHVAKIFYGHGGMTDLKYNIKKIERKREGYF